jgi:hypothetical protein
MRFALKQNSMRSSGAAAAAVAQAELNNLRLGKPAPADEDAIYQKLSLYHKTPEGCSPAEIARFFTANGFLASVIGLPSGMPTPLTTQSRLTLPESWRFADEQWLRENRIWCWRRGLRERDFDHDARVLLACATADGPHYLLARCERGNYYVMDPAVGADLRPSAFPVWAGLFGTDANRWEPALALSWLDGNAPPPPKTYYLGIAVWVNKHNAPHVLG